MINICMVGAGAIAAQHVKAFTEIGGVGFRWIVSRRGESATQFAQQWQFANSTTDLDVSLRDPEIDLVVITSPSELHVEQSVHSLLAGKNVAIEIPVALSLRDTKGIIDLANKLDRRVVACHTMRSFPGIREVRRRVQSEKLHLTHIVGHFAIPRRRNQGMAGKTRNWADNILWHHGCHLVDVSLWVTGANEAQDVTAMLGQPDGPSNMIMDAAVQFSTGRNQLVTHTLTYNTEQFCWEVRFIGQEETFIYRNGRLLNEAGNDVVAESSWIDLVAQNRAILDAMSRGVPSDYDLVSVLPAMQALHEAEIAAALPSANSLSQQEVP